MPNDDLLEQPDDLEIGFEGKKKKKKKAPAAGEAPEVAAPEAAVAPVSTPAPTSAPAAAAPVDDDLDILGDDSLISGKKKPKKKTEEKKPSETTAEPALDEDLVLKPTGRKKKPIDLDAFERELGEQDDDAGENSASHIEMHKDSADDEVRFTETAIVSDDPWSGSDRDYTYLELVDRVFRIIRQANPEAEGGKKRYTMIPPQVVREGTKKTVFANLSEICKRMHRQPEHVISFVFSELGTTGSVDGSQRLVIKGRFQPPQIETVLKSYIIEYVTCKICKSPDTILTKENRLTFMQCQACGAKRSVANIKTGFSAQIESRKKAM